MKVHKVYGVISFFVSNSIELRTFIVEQSNSVNSRENKRPMDHIAHLRKQFKSINTHDYIITLIKRRRRNIINLIKRIFLIS